MLRMCECGRDVGSEVFLLGSALSDGHSSFMSVHCTHNFCARPNRANESIVLPSTQYFLAGRMQIEGMLKLGCVASLDVAQRRVSIDYAGIAQVLQRHLILGLAQPVQIPEAQQ